VLRGLLIGIALGLAVWLLAIAVLLALGRRSQARELAVLIPNMVELFRGLLGDPPGLKRRQGVALVRSGVARLADST
jgi:hypothetical protein